MIIIHGDNTSQSRKKLQELIDQTRDSNTRIIRIEASKLTPAQLQENLGSNDLFGSDQLFIVEELHSLPTSTRKKDLIEQIAATGSNLILYEKKALTATMLKKFPAAQVFEFKITNTLWELLDNLGGLDKKKLLSKLQTAIDQNDAFLVFTMLVRQTRLLLQVKSGGNVAGAPFMVAKLKKQASQFNLEQLLALHSQLFKLEAAQKTSTNPLDLAHELDLLLFRL